MRFQNFSPPWVTESGQFHASVDVPLLDVLNERLGEGESALSQLEMQAAEAILRHLGRHEDETIISYEGIYQWNGLPAIKEGMVTMEMAFKREENGAEQL